MRKRDAADGATWEPEQREAHEELPLHGGLSEIRARRDRIRVEGRTLQKYNGS
jgi:hypothetical protein